MLDILIKTYRRTMEQEIHEYQQMWINSTEEEESAGRSEVIVGKER